MSKIANTHTNQGSKNIMLMLGGFVLVGALLVAFFMRDQLLNSGGKADEPIACESNLRNVTCRFTVTTQDPPVGTSFSYDLEIVSRGLGARVGPIGGTSIDGVENPDGSFTFEGTGAILDDPAGYECKVKVSADACFAEASGSCAPPVNQTPPVTDTPTPTPTPVPVTTSPSRPVCQFGPCPVDPDTGYKYVCDFDDCSDGNGCPAPAPGHCKPKGNPCNPNTCFECRSPEGRGLPWLKCSKYNPSDNTCSEWIHCESPSPTGATPPISSSVTPTKPFCPVAKVGGICL